MVFSFSISTSMTHAFIIPYNFSYLGSLDAFYILSMVIAYHTSHVNDKENTRKYLPRYVAIVMKQILSKITLFHSMHTLILKYTC